MIKQVFLVLILLQAITGYTQEYFQSNTIVKERITYDRLYEEGYGKEIFSLIGFENNVNARGLTFDIKSRILIRLSSDTQRNITAAISITRVSINGHLNIKGFNVDTLLWPNKFKARLNLFKNGKLMDSINILVSANGDMAQIFLSNDFLQTGEDLSAELSDIEFVYKKEQSDKLQKIATTIDNYYSFGKLLDNLVKKHSQSATKTSKTIENILIDKIEIDRVSNYINSYSFITALNLQSNDPLDFINNEKKLNRLSKRANTLFNQQVNQKKVNISPDPWNFCSYYYSLSLNFIEYAKLLQPSEAFAYYEVASIEPTITAKDNLKTITEFYSKNTETNKKSIYQCIFDGFAEMAENANTEENFTEALLLLNNAHAVCLWSGITKTSDYKSDIIIALDGVSSSYLKVGSVAFDLENLELASIYFSKADDIFESNKSLLIDDRLPDTSFSNYLSLQYKISAKLIKKHDYKGALERLSNAKHICSKMDNSTNCTMIDSAISLAHSRYLNCLIDTFEIVLDSNQYEKAYKKWLIASKYISKNNEVLIDVTDRFEKLSYALFLGSVDYGERLINEKETDRALTVLLMARMIITDVLYDYKELDRLLKFAIEPEIFSMIDKAVYHVWAYRIDDARELYNEAVELNSKYFLNRNKNINAALEQLSEQMKLRSCLAYSNNYTDAISMIHIAVKNEQYYKLSSFIDEAKNYVVTYPECNIDSTELHTLRKRYKVILEFYKRWDEIVELVNKRNYGDVIELYKSLLEYYTTKDVFHYDIKLYDLYTFISNQNLISLTKEAAAYQLKNNNPDKGLQYIDLYKKQSGDYKNIKQISTEVAILLAQRDKEQEKPVNESLKVYTSGDNWYNHFKIVYLKTRVVSGL